MINREFYFKSVSQTIRDTIHVYINILVIVGMFLCLYFLIGSEKIPDIYGANAQYIDLSIEVLFEALSLWHTLAYIGMTMHWLNFSSAYALLLVSLFVSSSDQHTFTVSYVDLPYQYLNCHLRVNIAREKPFIWRENALTTDYFTFFWKFLP